MGDYLIRGYNSEVRVVVVTCKDAVNEARERHQCSATAIYALGRLMAGGLLLATNLKEEKEALSLKISCDGPLEGIVVDASPTGGVRGYVKNSTVDSVGSDGVSNSKEAIGNGTLTVTRFLSNGETFGGTTPLISGEIASDLTHYLLSSEQIPSLMSLGVLVNLDLSIGSAGGIFIQALPGASDETLAEIENMIFALPPISQMLSEGNTPEEVIQLIFGRLPFEMGEPQTVGFYCGCSRDRMKESLITLGKAELEEMAKDEEEIELICHYCNEHYYFPSSELSQMANQL